MRLVPNIKALGCVVSDKKSFSFFPILTYVIHVIPRVDQILAPGA